MDLRDSLRTFRKEQPAPQLVVPSTESKGTPRREMPLRSFPPSFTPAEYHSAERALAAMDDDCARWFSRRVVAYYLGPGKGWPAEAREYAAVIDLLRWYNSR